MGEYNINSTSQTALDSTVSDYSVQNKTTDGSNEATETYWNNDQFTQYFGYYTTIPELKKAVDAYATWVLGKGYDPSDESLKVQLRGITGWGEDTFNSILWNMIVIKKVNGDAYAEVIRDPDTGELVNLKPLDPSSISTVVNDGGRIIRYEQRNKQNTKAKPKTYKPHQILHLVNDRVADEIHGRSVIEAVKWVIDARNEAMSDWRRISHRSTIRVLYVDEDDTTQLTNLKRDYAEGIKNGEVMILPGKPTDKSFQDLNVPQAENFLGWIRYLENFFYQAVGIPKVILGGSEEFTEASSKISYLTYEQIYTREVVELEADLFNQLGIEIIFRRPASLKNELLNSEEKNTGQVGFQPNDAQAGVGK